MSTKQEVEKQFRRIMKQEKLEIPLTPELVERMDHVVELLDLGSREKLVHYAILRFLDRYTTHAIEAT